MGVNGKLLHVCKRLKRKVLTPVYGASSSLCARYRVECSIPVLTLKVVPGRCHSYAVLDARTKGCII